MQMKFLLCLAAVLGLLLVAIVAAREEVQPPAGSPSAAGPATPAVVAGAAEHGGGIQNRGNKTESIPAQAPSAEEPEGDKAKPIAAEDKSLQETEVSKAKPTTAEARAPQAPEVNQAYLSALRVRYLTIEPFVLKCIASGRLPESVIQTAPRWNYSDYELVCSGRVSSQLALMAPQREGLVQVLAEFPAEADSIARLAAANPLTPLRMIVEVTQRDAPARICREHLDWSPELVLFAARDSACESLATSHPDWPLELLAAVSANQFPEQLADRHPGWPVELLRAVSARTIAEDIAGRHPKWQRALLALVSDGLLAEQVAQEAPDYHWDRELLTLHPDWPWDLISQSRLAVGMSADMLTVGGWTSMLLAVVAADGTEHWLLGLGEVSSWMVVRVVLTLVDGVLRRWDPVVQAEDIASEYMKNELSAERLEEERLCIQGTVTGVHRHEDGTPYIALLTEEPGIICNFLGEEAELAELLPGQTVIVEGKCAGLSPAGVQIEVCVLRWP